MVSIANRVAVNGTSTEGVSPDASADIPKYTDKSSDLNNAEAFQTSPGTI
jgi:hypothetical protein